MSRIDLNEVYDGSILTDPRDHATWTISTPEVVTIDISLMRDQLLLLTKRVAELEEELRQTRALVICEKHDDCKANAKLARDCAASQQTGVTTEEGNGE